MNNLLEGFKKLINKFNSLSKGIKIASIVSVITVIIAITSLFFYTNANKYDVLFSGLDSTDSQTIISALKENNVDMKVQGDAIMVPKTQVDQLRLELASTLTMGSTGYELMDSGSSFGMTDEEFQLKKTRMQQGELEKTIKSFSQITDARVHIKMPTNSVFVTEKDPGSAAVYVKLAAGKTLSSDQVKSIVALVSGSTTIAAENVQVMDSNMNLLSSDTYGVEEGNVSSDSVSTQLDLENRYETQLQNSILELLTPVLGSGKVKVVVNADLDFDSKKKTETVVDPNKVIISQHTARNENTSTTSGVSGGPIDENMGNAISDSNGSESLGSVSEEQTTNYEVGKTETIVISAPGEVRRLSASVIVDGEIADNLQKAIENSVAAAIGLDTTRGDQISVAGITFNSTDADNKINPFETVEASKNKLLYIGLGVGALALIIILLLVRRKKKSKEAVKEEVVEENLLDVVIDDKISKVNEEPLKPIEFEVTSEQQHIESEIKKYASEKPQQVADIVKSWLVESER